MNVPPRHLFDSPVENAEVNPRVSTRMAAGEWHASEMSFRNKFLSRVFMRRKKRGRRQARGNLPEIQLAWDPGQRDSRGCPPYSQQATRLLVDRAPRPQFKRGGPQAAIGLKPQEHSTGHRRRPGRPEALLPEAPEAQDAQEDLVVEASESASSSVRGQRNRQRTDAKTNSPPTKPWRAAAMKVQEMSSCREEERFTVPIEVAKLSNLVVTTLGDQEDDDDDGEDAVEIPLPNVKSPVLEKVIEYCTHYKQVEPMTQITTPLKSSKIEETVQEWYAEFVKVDQRMLFELVTAANFMDIKALLDITCLAVAVLIKVGPLGMLVHYIFVTIRLKPPIAPGQNSGGNPNHIQHKAGF
ncbi:hypothetical protein THAOC_35953 [Thalassiosira oceanica]|uniref:SKP1 component POZ domain-containing protein n=1 Tax=Thalassiosira oceanica TaxID=159749 RepID=K0R2K4_THAOC|nr:hypothetical protein THAOC_35953 [Thalassiosira oceanica]|eukprot:EJK45434.1 hypothetical protein THAOC_35953 [Thalassiosira oceanica]